MGLNASRDDSNANGQDNGYEVDVPQDGKLSKGGRERDDESTRVSTMISDRFPRVCSFGKIRTE